MKKFRNANSHSKTNPHSKIRCGNCGKEGHIYKDCVMPIMSMGIICIKHNHKTINHEMTTKTSISPLSPKIPKSSSPEIETDETDNKLRYLMICRKHSTAFVEFIRGKYELTNPKYLCKLFERMTLNELLMINKSSYKELYVNLWKNNIETQHYLNEFEKSNSKFKSLKDGYTHKDTHINLDKLLNSIECKWTEPEWGFPKGRRNSNETDINCATREFKEETDFRDDDYELINIDPISETYTSINRIRYKHLYYLSQIKNESAIPKISETNKHQEIEVSAIDWFTYEEAVLKIRDYQTEKLKVLEKVHKTLKNIIS